MSFVLHRTSDDRTAPFFQCDRCAKLIDAPRVAVILWNDDFKEESNTIHPHIVCKQCNANDPRTPLSMELQTAIVYLLNNLGIKDHDLHEARRITGLLNSIR